MRQETLREKDPPIYGENAVSLPRTFHEPPCSQCFVLHWHDCMELIRVRKGVLELHLDEQTTCSVLPGEVAVIAPRQAHQGIAGPSGVIATSQATKRTCGTTCIAFKHIAFASSQ